MSVDRIRSAFAETARNFEALQALAPKVDEGAQLMIESLRSGGKVLFCGNGGSAADAQHLAAELLGRFFLERAPLPAVALSVNSSTVTAIGNDYGYETVFERQLRGLGRAGDVLIGLSTSGNSENVIRAFEAARRMDIRVIGLTGQGGGRMAALCDLCLEVPSRSTPRIQEMHIAVGHIMCELAEAALAEDAAASARSG